jgi:hypothetical protein
LDFQKYGNNCEMWETELKQNMSLCSFSLTLREEQRWRICGTKGEEGAGGWTKLPHEELHDL